MKETFNIGDLVTSRTYGHGFITRSSNNKMPYIVIFDSGVILNYTEDGRIHRDLPVSLEKGHLIKNVTIVDGSVVYK